MKKSIAVLLFDTHEQADAAFKACIAGGDSASYAAGLYEVTTELGLGVRFKVRTPRTTAARMVAEHGMGKFE